MTTAVTSSSGWPRPLRVAFRFAFVFFLVSTIYLAPTAIPFVAKLGRPLSSALFEAYTWLRNLLFPPALYGTIASALAYLLTAVGLATFGTVVWSLLDRRTEYRRLHRGLRVYLRYFLALMLIGYGVYKLIPVQFPRPALASLITPLGEMERFGVLWSMMGTSPAYAALAGAAETVGSLLLFSPATTTLGTLILLPALVNVFALNFAFEVGVQLLSTIYLLIACFLLAPAVPRLVAALRPDPTNTRTTNRWRLLAPVAKWGLVALLVVIKFRGAFRDYRVWSDGVPLPRLYGIYQVDRFEVSGAAGASSAMSDTVRWNRVAIGERGGAAIQPIRGPVRRYRVKDDSIRSMLRFEREGMPGDTVSFRYGHDGGLHLHGTIGGDSVTVLLHQADSSALRLRRRVR